MRKIVCIFLLSAAIGACVWQAWARVLDNDASPSVVTVAGVQFRVAIVEDAASQHRGLSDREALSPDEGMLFVFEEPAFASLVMRDCAFPLDVLYLDSDARVIDMHEMKVEPPRTRDERAEDEKGNAAYESRLPLYISSDPAAFALELPAGTVRRLGIKKRDVVALPSAWPVRALQPP